ncbi:AraC family transcriptional regulator [Bacillaceae bacterium S4-13-56]
MTFIESLQKSINYMEDHLLEDISLEEIAEQSNVSPFHFQRTFTILTDISVGEYLKRRRLTCAAEELTRTDIKIIDLAYKYGYETPEAFTKAFRRLHGVSPSEARKGEGKLQFYQRLMIQVNLKGADPMRYRMVEREAFQVVGIRREFSLVNEENLVGIPKFWDEFNASGSSDSLLPFIKGEIKGFLGVCVDKTTPQSKVIDYWISVEHEGGDSGEYELLDIPAAKWAVFEVHGAMPHAIQKVWKQIFSEWFPSSGYQPAGGPELEVYTDGDTSSSDYYSEIWIPVK